MTGYGGVFGDFAGLGAAGIGSCCKGLNLKQTVIIRIIVI